MTSYLKDGTGDAVGAARLPTDPCGVAADELVLGDTSNWAAYALVAALEARTLGAVGGGRLLPTPERGVALLQAVVDAGGVDGITLRPEATVDGFAPEVEAVVLQELRSARDAEMQRRRKNHMSPLL